MSNRDLSLALRLYTDASRFVAGLTQAKGGVRSFTQGARQEFEAFKGSIGSVRGQLAQLGLSVGAVATAVQSARMDKGLTQIGQTAGVSKAEVAALRGELFRMAGETGQQVDDLKLGFDNAVQSGLNFREALPVIGATNKAMAVTGASADRLTASLTVASTAYDFDLSKPGMALGLLDKMTVAGRQGNAELQNLSDIFGRVGVNAASGGMGFEKTLAFIEALSLVERQPERLATLADSTLRLFTNLNYMKDAAQATGVRFFDSKGARRDPIETLKDIKRQYDALTTDKDRALFVQKAFGKADLDTIKGLRTLLGGDMLNKVGQFERTIRDAGGTIQRDLPEAISNAVDQTGRLKAELRNAADAFAQPINDSLQNLIKWGLDKKENGGLGLDGKDMVLGGGALALGTLAAARYGGKAISGLAKRFGGTAVGVAEGKALEAAAGVTPVFVVNWPASIGGASVPGLPPVPPGVPGTAGKVAKAGMLARLLPALDVGATAALPLTAMWGVKEWAEDTSHDQERVGVLLHISKAIGSIFGDKDAEIEARRRRNQADLVTDDSAVDQAMAGAGGRAEVSGEIRVRVDQDGRVASVRARTDNPSVPMNVDAGLTMVMP